MADGGQAEADVVVSTGHKAKGREWPTVKVATDFEPKAGGRKDPAENSGMPATDLGEARLACVAVTRARQRLDLGGLSGVGSARTST